jgi:predicted O-methyltransferase YrrM
MKIKSLAELKHDTNGMINCNIEGWMHKDEAKIIEKTLPGKKNILELGTYQGLSTSIIASFCDADAKITTVEIFKEQQEKAKHNLTMFDNIDYINEDSNTWLSNIKTEFDWVFVDHSHDTFYMDTSMMKIKQVVSPDHIILLHDMHLPGVQSQQYKFMSLTRIRNMGIGVLF